MNDKEYFTVIIEAEQGEEAFIQAFWAHALHLGEAIDRVSDYAYKLDIQEFKVSEADTYDFGSVPEDAIEDNGIYYDSNRYYYPADEYSNFHFPYGIVPACIKSEYGTEEIREGYSKFEDNEFKHIEIVVNKSNLLRLYLDIIEKMGRAKVVWIKIIRDWESANTMEFYTNQDLTNVKLIEKFIKRNFENIFLNGYVSITVYYEEGETNLNLDEHKKIHLITRSNRTFETIVAYINSCNYDFYDYNNFRKIDYRYYHWHYRPTNSIKRKDLIDELKVQGFVLWRTE